MPKLPMASLTFASIATQFEKPGDCPVDLKTSRLCYTDGHGEIEIDESLYSRQLYVLGHDSMKRMSTASVLISGLGGLGAEIAKNVILSGVRRVVLHDRQNVAATDLSSQFYLTEKDIGRNRAEACHGRFAELNSYVTVEHSSLPLTPELLFDFQVVVLCNYLSYDEILPISDFCHQSNVKFILASTRGLFGQLFCDFGDEFDVLDADGEEPVSVIIESVTNDEESGVVTLTDNGGRGFSEGDTVIFKHVRGATGLNECGPVKIKSLISPFEFCIGDTSCFGDYEGGGIVTQVKQPISMSFKSLRQSIAEPQFVTSDFAKIERQEVLHLAFYCLGLFANLHNNGKLPEPRNHKTARNFVEFCKAKNMLDQSLLDANLLEEFASQSTGDVCPMNCVIGGVAAQEVIKSVSGKFTPLRQWLYFDALECLPFNRTALTEKECSPVGSRYDAQVAVFGRSFVEKLLNLKLFLVGAGALGCEMLKNWAMMGVGCSSNGKVTLTDMDIIERSNLNRQFLFRENDIQQPKSERAAAACRKMNPEMNIVAHRNRVAFETEEIYNDDFFSSLDVVMNALDNVESRKYVDGRCIYYRKPLLESGTLGTKGNVQVVLPGLTESYSSSQDPPDKSYPICTIKNFPFAIEHTLQWARELFDACFRAPMFHAIQYIDDPDFTEKLIKNCDSSQIRSILHSIKRLLATDVPTNFEDCVKWARLFWEENFVNQTRQMLFIFPPDVLTTEGIPFWSGSKRLPRQIPFDIKNQWHLSFVVAGANLRAQMFGIAQVRDMNAIIQMIGGIYVPSFIPNATGASKQLSSDQEGSSNGSENSSDNDEHHLSISEIIESLPNRKLFQGKPFKAIEFEKDDDSNFHMDFITAASNSRAEIYDIPLADKHKSRLIAGRIIPAIATTTSVVVGLVCLELYKIVQRHEDVSKFKNGFINLALPFFAFSTPLEPKSRILNGKKWNLWDRYIVEGEPTLAELINKLKAEHRIDVTMLSSGVVICYTDLMEKAKLQRRRSMKIGAVLEEITGKKLPSWQKVITLDICCTDADGNDVDEVPPVHYVLSNGKLKS